MIIEKNQDCQTNFLNTIYYFPRARDAFRTLLDAICTEDIYLLLPAFIGVSPKEGSGLYDPVQDSSISHSFYKMTEKLFIDQEDLMMQIQRAEGKKIVLLLVHYWGYVDFQYEKIADMARKKGVFVIEDMAHALYTEYVDHKCGYLCDASFYAFHKMFPMKDGGMLKIRIQSFPIINSFSETRYKFPIEYDLVGIAERRKENALLWEELLKNNREKFEILRPSTLFSENTPQTFPVRILGSDRYKLYLELNENGYGVVSLYHTLIPPLNISKYKDSCSLSEQILNLPVHQDVSRENILKLYQELLKAYEMYSYSRVKES